MRNSERVRLALTDPRKAMFKAVRSNFFNGCEDAAARLFRPPSDAVVNANEVRVLGMQRSGNHAIIDWLTASFGGKSLHINNIVPNQNAYRFCVQYPDKDASTSFTRRMQNARFKNFEKLNLLILSYEDCEPEPVFQDLYDPRHDLHYGRSGYAWNILILRDPLNMLASRMKYGKTRIQSPQAQVALWLKHAKYAIDFADRRDFILIKYNDWVKSREYREALQVRFGLEPVDVPTEKVSEFGGGSSFDGTKLNGRASEMAVLERWRSLENHPELREIAKDEQLLSYASKIFGIEY